MKKQEKIGRKNVLEIACGKVLGENYIKKKTLKTLFFNAL
jgi:hypothetical protein